MKKSIFKKVWFWLLVVVIIAVIGAGGSKDKKENQENKNTVQETTDIEDSTDTIELVKESVDTAEKITIEEQVLLERDGIKITAKELTEDSIWGYELAVLIENTSEQNITVQVQNMSVNGIMTEPMFSCDVAAGKNANAAITLMDTSLEASGITTIQNMELSFHVFNTESWDTIFDSDVILLSTSADGTQEQVINSTGTKVLEENGISIIVQKMDTEKSFWGADIYVYIENTSEQNITVQAQNVSINGFMVEPVFSSDVVSGKKAFDSITFLESDLTENGIETIEELELSFHIFNTESWETILDSEEITVTFEK